jgi:hypothetical protein
METVMKKTIVGSLLALVSAFLMFGCTPSGTKTYPNAPFKGVVEDGSKETFLKVADATVWLIPATDVAAMGKTPIEVKKDSPNDEPLEDSLAANRGRYLNAKTNAKGEFSFADVPGGKYFVYVEPATSKYLPGGDKSRKALGTDELGAAPMLIKISGNVPPNATYIGSTACIECHEDQKHFTKTLHRLGMTVIGKPSKLQDHSRFPEFNKGLDKLLAGTKFWFYGFDPKRGFDKYQISTKAPADAASVSFTATFYKDSDGKLKFRAENAKDPKDPARIYPVEMTYGGGLYKQRYLVRIGANLFPFVQFNQNGDDSFADRSRKPWRDYHGDWFYNEQTTKLADPPQGKSFDKECASCHYAGYTLTKNAKGDYIAGAAKDRNGEMDIDGDGKPNEINLGCETCHGPGSVHDKAKEIDMPATIVSPNKLSAERADVLCGQCHSRPQGFLNNDQPVNKDNKMMLPGTSRNRFLTEYTTRPDGKDADFWADGLHSKSHHQPYSDLIKAKKYRNGTQLVACSDCHDTHGNGKSVHQLKNDPKTTEVCTACHKDSKDMKAHLADKAKCTVDVSKISCSDCHNAKTAQTGAGFGKGLLNKDGKNYWVNDISSHVYDVPRKDNKGVKGVAPGAAMPIPYTNSCGAACHDTKNL